MNNFLRLRQPGRTNLRWRHNCAFSRNVYKEAECPLDVPQEGAELMETRSSERRDRCEMGRVPLRLANFCLSRR